MVDHRRKLEGSFYSLVQMMKDSVRSEMKSYPQLVSFSIIIYEQLLLSYKVNYLDSYLFDDNRNLYHEVKSKYVGQNNVIDRVNFSVIYEIRNMAGHQTYIYTTIGNQIYIKLKLIGKDKFISYVMSLYKICFPVEDKSKVSTEEVITITEQFYKELESKYSANKMKSF